MADFDWVSTGHDEEWWSARAIEAGIRRGSQAVQFVASKMLGKSNTEAARCCGAKGPPNTSGYRLARSNEVRRLFAVVQAETGSTVGNVDAAESRRILSQLARSSDPSLRIRAVEAIAKMDERDRELSATQESHDPIHTLNELGALDPLLAKWLASQHGITWSIPAPNVAAALTRLEQVKEWVLADAMRARGDDRGGSGLEASGNGAAKPGA